jgi:hypothetical protein
MDRVGVTMSHALTWLVGLEECFAEPFGGMVMVYRFPRWCVGKHTLRNIKHI